MNKLQFGLITLLITAVGFPIAAKATNTFCTGATTGTFDNVAVPSGASCTLSGAVINGNVQVAEAASLTVTGPGPSSIAGNVEPTTARQCS